MYGVYIGATHLYHLLQKNLHLRNLFGKTTLHKRIIGQQDFHHYLITTLAVVYLLTMTYTDVTHHITNDTIARKQFVVAEYLDIGWSHNAVACSHIITRQTG